MSLCVYFVMYIMCNIWPIFVCVFVCIGLCML